jgi:hypothetical protein
MKKRKSPIAQSLVNNSISGMYSAIEIHNKPTIRYRYEMVVLLILNSWELLLKGYLHKYHKNIKLVQKDSTTKPFENCLNIVSQKIGKEFNPIMENLGILYEYRNQVAHYYISDLDPIIFSLISKSIIFYSDFIKKHFKIDLSDQSDLILLPIGFKRTVSPIDYISSASFNEKSSKEVKEFLFSIINATKRLQDEEIKDTIFVDFRISLLNVNRITNADLIAGIDNTQSNAVFFSVNKNPKKVVLSKEGQKITLTRDREEAEGTLYYEELHEGIFDEINNVVETNRILTKENHQFSLGPALYYRIYSERQHVNFNIETFSLLARAGMLEFYSPFLYWLTKLPVNIIADIMFDLYHKLKSPCIYNILKLSIIMGTEVTEIFKNLIDKEFKSKVQKPEFVYTFKEMLKSRNSNPILKALRVSGNKIFGESYQYSQLLNEPNLPLNLLSKECINVFKGDISKRSITRELDYLAYSKFFIDNEPIISEIKKKIK